MSVQKLGRRPGPAWRISQKYDSTVAAIARENGLRDPTKLAIGQKLKVPVGVKGRSSHARARVGAKPKVEFLDRLWPLDGP